MRHEATLTYTPQLLRRAVTAYWRRTTGTLFFVGVLYVAAGLVWLLWRGDRSWLVGVLAMSLFMGIAFSAAVYVMNLRSGLRKLGNMGHPTATLVAEDATFTLTSGMGTSTLPWSSVAKVWRFDAFWLLMFAPGQYVTLPLASVPAAMQAFVLEKIQAAGGKLS